jgi:hypothetical protein
MMSHSFIVLIINHDYRGPFVLQGLFTGGFAKTATTLRTAGGAAC